MGFKEFRRANHPVWPFLRFLVMMLGLCVTLYVNASHFDETEMKTIITMFLIAGGTEGGISAIVSGIPDGLGKDNNDTPR